VTRHHSCRVSPFGHPRIHARLTAPRGISQPPTSFIGSQCQGIHHAPLNTYNTKPKNESPTHTPQQGTCEYQKNLHYTRQQPTQSAETNHASRHQDARNHYPQIKHHTPPPKQGSNQNPRKPPRAGTHPHSGVSPRACCLRTQQCVWQSFRINRFPPANTRSLCTRTTPTTGAAHLHESPKTRTPTRCGQAWISWCSLERR
jgi:hypothetical protein